MQVMQRKWISNPAIPDESVVGMILGCELFGFNQIEHTNFFLTDKIFRKFVESYFRTKAIHSDPRAKQANILSHLTAKFPPSYFTNSNFASFQN